MKILMTTMSLDIGGAETHITELAKSLQQRGYCVTVASNGGVYVPILEACGIKHVKLPLHTKKPLEMLKSYFGLKALIKREKFDIVHAHARIPAYLCGLLQKSLKFNFVTSAHGTFEVNPLLKRISNWGDRTLAVSYDIKHYLIENYGIFTDNIKTTVNGIDMMRFREQDGSAVCRELSLDFSSIKLIHVSRLDIEVSSVAHQLIQAVSQLRSDGLNVQLVLVGDGTDFASLKSEADELNSASASPAVIMTGSRTDVDKLLSCADLFVGVSRSALEAMAEKKLCILAGSQGFGGLFTPELLDVSLNTNFCFRGRDLPSVSALVTDIKRALSLDSETADFYRSFGQSVVKQYYSVDRMCADAESVYSELCSLKRYRYGDVILSGYYGFGNLGDDSLLEAILRQLRSKNPSIRVTVLSKTPRETAKRYGVLSVNRFDILRISSAMRHAKLLINGGGSLLQNSTSTRSLLYYIYIMKLARRHGLKLMLYGSGIGPLYGARNKERCRKILDQVDEVFLREESSYNEVISLGAKPHHIAITVDPAFSTVPADECWVKYLCEKCSVNLNDNLFAISLRSWHSCDEACKEKLLFVIREIMSRYNLTPVFISMQHEKDFALCSELSCAVGGYVLEGLSASELCFVMSKMKLVIAMRLHALIYALSVGTPTVGLSYDPKVSSVMASFDLPYCVDIDSFEQSHLCSLCFSSLDNHDIISEKITSELAYKKSLSDIESSTACSIVAEHKQ